MRNKRTAKVPLGTCNFSHQTVRCLILSWLPYALPWCCAVEGCLDALALSQATSPCGLLTRCFLSKGVFLKFDLRYSIPGSSFKSKPQWCTCCELAEAWGKITDVHFTQQRRQNYLSLSDVANNTGLHMDKHTTLCENQKSIECSFSLFKKDKQTIYIIKLLMELYITRRGTCKMQFTSQGIFLSHLPLGKQKWENISFVVHF